MRYRQYSTALLARIYTSHFLSHRAQASVIGLAISPLSVEVSLPCSGLACRRQMVVHVSQQYVVWSAPQSYLRLIHTDPECHLAQLSDDTQSSAGIRWPYYRRDGLILPVLAHTVSVPADSHPQATIHVLGQDDLASTRRYWDDRLGSREGRW